MTMMIKIELKILESIVALHADVNNDYPFGIAFNIYFQCRYILFKSSNGQ